MESDANGTRPQTGGPDLINGRQHFPYKKNGASYHPSHSAFARAKVDITSRAHKLQIAASFSAKFHLACDLLTC